MMKNFWFNTRIIKSLFLKSILCPYRSMVLIIFEEYNHKFVILFLVRRTKKDFLSLFANTSEKCLSNVDENIGKVTRKK